MSREGKSWGAVPTAVEEGSSWGAVPAAATKKRKLGTATERLGISDHFAVDLMRTCAVPRGRMSSPKLRESSARMLEVTGGRWPRNVPIPQAAGEDMFTSRIAREMKIFPYGWNIVVVVSTVMDKDRQDATRKRRAFTWVGDPSREVKKARGVAKFAAPGGSKPPPATKPVVPGPSKPSSGARAVAPGSSKLPLAEPTQERGPPSPLRTAEAEAGGADLSMDICVDDYRMGGVMMFDARTGRGLVGEFLFIIIIFLFFLFFSRGLGLGQDCDAGSDAGQLAVVPALVPAAPTAAATKAKGASQDPWSKFCASGEITSAAPLKTRRVLLRSS
jgi:hypothetical protein